MLTAQEKARILAKIRKDSYGITLEQMKHPLIHLFADSMERALNATAAS